MNPSAFTALGIDVGGTKIAAGIVKFPNGDVVAEQTLPTVSERGSQAVLSDVIRLADALAANAKAAGMAVNGVGLALCELVDVAGTIISRNSVSWDSAEVRRRLDHLGPVTFEADVRAAARAEAIFGAGRSLRTFLYVTIGTGIACSLVIDGAPYLGAHGATGTMASSPVSFACQSCGHVNNRSLEEIASGPGLVARYNQLQSRAAATAHDVLAAAARDDTDAVSVVRNAAEVFGATLGLLINVLDPQAVIVGGGLGLSEGLYWDSLITATRRHIWSEVCRELPILRAATGIRAGIIGSAVAAWKKYDSKSEGSPLPS